MDRAFQLPGAAAQHLQLGAVRRGAILQLTLLPVSQSEPLVGLRAGLKYRGPVKEELETVLRIDPSFMNGSADRVLGRWYDRVPGLFGGSDKKAEAHLRASLQYDEHSTVSRYFLAELLLDTGRKGEAKGELQKILDAPFNPEWAPEDAEYKEKARTLLAKIK